MGRPEMYEGTCPHCQHPFRTMLFSSAYIDSVRMWSDGYQECDGWDNSGEEGLRLCPTCNRLMELSKAYLSMQHEPEPPPAPRKSYVRTLSNTFRRSSPVSDKQPLEPSPLTLSSASPGAKMIHPSSIQQELDNFPLPVDVELRLRHIAWQRWNHSEISNKPTHAWHKSNMESLLPLLEKSTQDSILSGAELLRQLGRFDEALDRLREGTYKISETQRYIAELMTRACSDGRTEPFVIKERFNENE
jgi:hypothetical protein